MTTTEKMNASQTFCPNEQCIARGKIGQGNIVIHAGMYLIGCTYNFCWAHHELSKSVEKGGFGTHCTPAMASGLTDHLWSVFELLSYKVAPPPLLFPVPKRGRGRPRVKPLPDPTLPKRSRGRPRKLV